MKHAARSLLLCAVALALTGCGVGSSDTRHQANAPTSSSQSVAQIEMVPPPTVTVGSVPPAVGGAHATPEPTRRAGPSPTPRPDPPPDPGTGRSKIIEGGPNDRLEIALTFDAGADSGYAAAILDRLADEGVVASFGMTGQWAEDNPDLVRRIVSEGHMLFNHTLDHRSMTGKSTGTDPQTATEIAESINTTHDIVERLTGYDMRPYFRPPYGDFDETSLGYLADLGYYITVWWTCDTRAWNGWDAAKITGYCTTNIKPHEIILMHVGAQASGDYESLPNMIDFFRGEGYAFVTVEQMLRP